jgi:hypothetical protein
MLEYIGISPDMIGYVRLYWDISRYGRISPEMVGYDKVY